MTTTKEEVERMLKNPHVKLLKGSLTSRFDPYEFSAKGSLSEFEAKTGRVGNERHQTIKNTDQSETLQEWQGSEANPKAPPFRSKTEARMAERLDDEGIEYLFEPFNLTISRVGNRITSYRPDFYVPDTCTFIEVKGGFIREKSVLKFKMACQLYGELFNFDMWQWKNGVWKCILRSST